MQCHQAQEHFTAYLDGELDAPMYSLVQSHLDTCLTCQHEIAALSATRAHLNQTLHQLADPVLPSPQAWTQLQARLATESMPTYSSWLSRLGIIRFYQGDTMFRRKLATAAAALTLIFVAFTALWLRTPPTVSAKEVLDRAYAAQQAQGATSGIHHLQLEQYSNLELVSQIKGAKLPPQEISTITESYRDLESGKYRSVTSNTADNLVTYVSAYDGTYLYSSAEESTPLTVYRSAAPAGWYEIYGYDALVANEMAPQDAYELARQSPDTTLVGEEQWIDGRQVYVLRASLSLPDQAVEAYNLSYFDKTTYKFLETRTFIVQDGKESVATFARYLADEILPASTAVTWDLSDVQGITIVEDTNGEHSGPWLEAITQQELAARVPNAYLLSSVPEGFTLTIAASKTEEGVYMIMYRSKTGDYILLQPDDGANRITDETATTYTTASGLMLTFKPAASAEEGAYAIVTAPDTTFSISSSLPRSQIEPLAETLIPAK